MKYRYFVNRSYVEITSGSELKGLDSLPSVGSVLYSHACAAFCIAPWNHRTLKLISQTKNYLKSCRGQFIVLMLKQSIIPVYRKDPDTVNVGINGIKYFYTDGNPRL